jgi:putative oxidoreductase
VLLAIGLATRFSALVLSVFNYVAVILYPGLFEAGVKNHFYWVFLMLVPLLYGPGVISLDHFMCRKLMPEQRNALSQS